MKNDRAPLRQRAIDEGRIVRYRHTADELDAKGFHVAAAAARYAIPAARANVTGLVSHLEA